MLLKALSINNDWVDFTVFDCPVYMEANIIALTGRKGSDLLQADTIVRGDKNTNVFEGDRVYESDELVGYVIYSKGFKLQKLNGQIEDLVLREHIQLKQGNKETIKIISSNEQRTRLLFSDGESVVQLTVFLLKNSAGKIGVMGRTCKANAIDPSKLRFFTGLTKEDGELLFFDNRS